MKTIKFDRCRFLQSSDGKNVPPEQVPHIVFVGRSNVGKSSLINHFFQNKNLARISATPGKTQLLQFFAVDESIYFVDLPGYGFAKRSKRDVASWEKMIERYLLEHMDKIIFLHLIDVRHPPSAQDEQFMQWVEAHGKKVVCILTKIDKIKKSARTSWVQKYTAQLENAEDVVPYTITESKSRDRLRAVLQKRVNERKEVE